MTVCIKAKCFLINVLHFLNNEHIIVFCEF